MFEFLETKLFWLTATLLTAAYLFLKLSVYNYWKKQGIPHEAPLIPFGNIPISVFTGSLSLGNFIKESYEKFRQHPFHGLYVFHRPVIMINDPELIRLVLVKEFDRFCDRGWFVDEKVDPLSNNLFLQPGEQWKRLRRKFSPTFTPGKLRQMYPLMEEVSNEMIKACNLELRTTDALDIKDVIGRYATDIIASVVYGLNCNSLKDPNVEFRRLGVRAFEFGRINMLIAVFLPEILESITLPFYHKEVREFFGKIFNDTLDYRRTENVLRNDFMNLLMQLMDKGKVDDDEKPYEENKVDDDPISRTEAAAQAFVFFLAGFETSSATTAYCLFELAMNLDIQEKLQREIDEVAESSTGFTFDSIMEMEYLDMVFSETIRKYPSVAFLNRLCMEDYAIPNSNYTIPKGMRLLITPLGIHYNPDYFPNPEKFDPNRFTKENLASRSPYVHLAFGEGPRNCIGKRFGILQTKLALAMMLHKYNFYISYRTKLPVKQMTESFVISPEDGLYLRVESRRK